MSALDPTQLLDHTQANAQPMLAFLQDLVRIPSVNGRDSENEVAQRVAREARNLGLEVQLITKNLDHTNVVVTLGRGSTSFDLIAHMDTVAEGDHASWNSPPFEAAIVDGNMIGRGTADNKAGLACGLYAMQLLRDQQMLDLDRYQVVLAGVVDEESGACSDLGVHHLLQEGLLHGKGAIYAYASDIVCIGHRGLIRLELTARGESTHAGLAEWHQRRRGVNAVSGLADILLRLEDLQIPVTPVRGFEHLGCTITPGTQFSGGNYPSVVPEKAVAMIDIRLLPGQNASQVLASVQQVIDKVTKEREGLIVSSELLVNIPGAAIDYDHPLANIAQKHARQYIGGAWEKRGAGPANEGYMLIGAGIPTLCGFGPTGGNAHAPNEWVSVESLPRTSAMFAAIVQEYLSKFT